MGAYKILLPVRPDKDYDHMIRSGINVANALRGKLCFLYITEVPEYKGYPPGSVAVSTISNIEEQRKEYHEHYLGTLDRFKKDISADTSTEFISTEGSWLAGILKSVNSLNPDMLILEHEHKGILDKILGDTNTEVIHEVDCPVWIIPENDTMEIPEKIGFLLNHNADDIEVLKKLMKLCRIFESELHLLHPTDDDYDARIQKSGFRDLIKEDFPDCEAIHHDFQKKNITEDLAELIDESNFDLLTVQNDDSSSLKRLFSRSSVEKLMHTVEIPLAIY
jgi:nucleotide-binding universal stress UspA family protein